MNKLFVISGPAGVGKTTIALKLFKTIKNLQCGTTYMTRKKRNDKEDKKIVYVDKPEFEKMIEQDKFWEWAEFYDNYYGTAKAETLDTLNKGPVLLNIDTKGAMKIKQQFPQAVLIFILPESLEILKSRLEKRGTINSKELDMRMEKAQVEIKQAAKYDYSVINQENKFLQTVDQISVIIKENL